MSLLSLFVAFHGAGQRNWSEDFPAIGQGFDLEEGSPVIDQCGEMKNHALLRYAHYIFATVGPTVLRIYVHITQIKLSAATCGTIKRNRNRNRNRNIRYITEQNGRSSDPPISTKAPSAS